MSFKFHLINVPPQHICHFQRLHMLFFKANLPWAGLWKKWVMLNKHYCILILLKFNSPHSWELNTAFLNQRHELKFSLISFPWVHYVRQWQQCIDLTSSVQSCRMNTILPSFCIIPKRNKIKFLIWWWSEKNESTNFPSLSISRSRFYPSQQNMFYKILSFKLFITCKICFLLHE